MTETATLTDRYIYAATRALPEHSRGDLAAELRASIADAVLAREEHGEPAELAEREVLTDLGDPSKLGARYADRPLTLIGPNYFLDWWRMLKILLWIVPACAAAGVAIAQAVTGATVGEVIGSVVATLISVIVHVGFWTTLVFALLEWTQPARRRPMLPWSLDQLPDLRRPGRGRAELVGALVFLALAVTAIFWDRFVGFVRSDGDGVAILAPDLWPWWIAGLIVLMLLEAVLAIVVYRRGRWTPGLAAVNTILAAAVAVPVIFLIATGGLVNPAFVDLIAPGGESGAAAAGVAPIVAAVASVAVAAAALWDAVDGWVKTVRDRRRA